MLVLLLGALATHVLAEDIRFPVDSCVINVREAPYNAKGDGVADDTAAIQQAIGDQLGKRGIIYLPNGTYRLSDSLNWKRKDGTWFARLVLRGQSRDGVVLRLNDQAPGFADKKNPKGVIVTASENPFNDGGNNQGFMNDIRNLTVHTGKGNPGAAGVDYVVSNQGALKDVKIISGDGEGYAGIRMERSYPGPGLIKNVEITGFDYGVRQTVCDYSMTYDSIRLKGQKVGGMYLTAMAHIYNLTSVNTVPVIDIQDGVSILLKADLSGGTAMNPACRIGAKGRLVARDLKIGGYGTAIEDAASAAKGLPMGAQPTVVDEYFTWKVQSVFDSPAHSLRLPIEDTPVYADGDPATWANIADFGATPCTWGGKEQPDSTAAIQKAMDSGKATVFIGGGTMGDIFYKVSGTISIPATVRHVVGTNRFMFASGDHFAKGPKPVFKVVGESANPLILENLDLGGGVSGAIAIEQAAKRTLVIQHCTLSGNVDTLSYVNSVSGGKVFAEDIIGGRWRISGPQQFWARQFNTEYGDKNNPCIAISGTGARAWILGMKTENSAGMNLVKVERGAEAEILGLFSYTLNWEPEVPMIINNEGRLAVQWWTAGQKSFKIQVRETRDGVTKDLAEHWGIQAFYTGYKTTLARRRTMMPGKT